MFRVDSTSAGRSVRVASAFVELKQGVRDFDLEVTSAKGTDLTEGDRALQPLWPEQLIY